MNVTIFDTPILTGIFHHLSKLFMRLAGWHVEGTVPDLPKFVVVGAPHTSNWDFMLFLALAFHFRLKVFYMGKAELFRWPFGGLFRWLGGYPVDRAKSQGMVEQMADVIRKADRFILVITPEGTRHKVTAWKSGFYHIAQKAGVPILLAYIDGAHKGAGIGPLFHPSGNAEKDIKAIQAFYAKFVGIHPHRTSEL